MPYKNIYIFTIFFLFSCGGGGGGGSYDSGVTISINPIINTFTSSSSSIDSGETITLSWSTTNTISCSADGDWDGDKAQTGSQNLQLSQAKTYTFILNCRGEDPANVVSKSIDVQVNESDTSASIYSVDKSSYCATPNNDSSSYWIEDFSNDTLDDSVFTYQESNGFCSIEGCPNGDDDWVRGWGNDEKQYYTSCRVGYSKRCNAEKNTTENVFIEDGFLKIQPIYYEDTYGSLTDTTEDDPFEDPYCSDGSCSYTWEYTSARIMTSSKKIISPGSEITVCFKIPEGSGSGHWPAIWMLPQGFIEYQKSWPYDGENDLMEHMKYHQPYETQSTIHYGDGGAQPIYKVESVPANVNFYEKFHSVTLKWEIDRLEYYLDTQATPYFSIEKSNETAFNNYYWPFNDNFYLLLNVAVGGSSGGEPDKRYYCKDLDCNNLADKDKGRMLIDYIEIKSID